MRYARSYHKWKLNSKKLNDTHRLYKINTAALLEQSRDNKDTTTTDAKQTVVINRTLI